MNLSRFYQTVSNLLSTLQDKLLILYFPVAPKWIEEPSNTSLLLGQRGIVYCNANGYPTPQIHWMKRDGKDVLDYLFLFYFIMSGINSIVNFKSNCTFSNSHSLTILSLLSTFCR